MYGNYGYYSFFINKMDRFFYIFVLLPIFIISIIVSLKLKNIYRKYSKVESLNKISGAVVARNILDSYGCNNIKVVSIEGNLTDHFDPTSNVVRLSYKNYNGTSIASIGVAAHEVGHALQHAKNYKPIKIHSMAVPIANFGSILSMPIMFIGFIISNLKLIRFGIFLFSFVILFQLITLPVEFNASYRAINILRKQRILNEKELGGVKKVLWAAAMTYVVSFISSLAELLRLILVSGSRNDDD